MPSARDHSSSYAETRQDVIFKWKNYRVVLFFCLMLGHLDVKHVDRMSLSI